MTRLRAEVRVGRGHWYAACDRCGWSKWAETRVVAADLAESHNEGRHATKESR